MEEWEQMEAAKYQLFVTHRLGLGRPAFHEQEVGKAGNARRLFVLSFPSLPSLGGRPKQTDVH